MILFEQRFIYRGIVNYGLRTDVLQKPGHESCPRVSADTLDLHKAGVKPIVFLHGVYNLLGAVKRV